nr:annexin D5 [Ipomoea batatas]
MATFSAHPVLTSPRDDAMHLYKAFKGLGCDTAAVINILAHRDATQRALIQQEYRTMYSEELTKRLVSELSGKVEKAVLLWMHDPAGRDATIIRQSLRETSDYKAVTEVICSRTPAQLQYLKQIYHSKFGVYLEHDLQVLSGDHQKAIKSETSGLFEFGLLTILQCAQNPAKYFAKALHKAMKGMGTDDATLIRIVVTRAEIDMQYIKGEYHKKFKKSLNDAVHSETSGHYRAFLLLLLGPNH